MSIRGFIEINPEIDPELLRQLIPAAQRAAASSKVILALNGVPPEAVTTLLDPARRFDGHGEGGLRYRVVDPIGDELLAQAEEAEFVIADSERLSAALLSRGILHMRAREGVSYLRTLLPPHEGRSSHTPGFLASW